jgi:hypothetical protein
MSGTVLTHDASFEAFDDAGGVVESTDDDTVSFSWDEQYIVTVDAPSDLEGAFDTNQFYKIEDATIARPIKQPYLDDGEIKWYKKPAAELQKAAWSFDNAPYTLDHPNTGMVKDVNDVHGFWRNIRYRNDDDRLLGDLYVPSNDDDALDFIEEHTDVSAGFYNRVLTEYDGDTGDLTDDDVDGFQTDMFGNHIAGVEKGRCSGEDGCGLDDQPHGKVVLKTDSTMVERTTDQPSGIKSADGTWYAVGPNEHTKDSTEHTDDHMYPVDGCSNVEDAWNLRGSAKDLKISEETLAQRIVRAAEAQNCENVPSTLEEQMDTDIDNDENCDCTDNNTTMTDEFDIPDLSTEAIAEQHDGVSDLREQRDSLRAEIDEMADTIETAFDEAEHFSVEMEEDECPCEAVTDLVSDLDSKVEEITDLRDELDEYRGEEIDEKLDELEELGADRDEWEETADEADDPLTALDEEIERREEVLDATDNATVKGVDKTTDEDTDTDTDTTMGGTRKFSRGYGA